MKRNQTSKNSRFKGVVALCITLLVASGIVAGAAQAASNLRICRTKGTDKISILSSCKSSQTKITRFSQLKGDRGATGPQGASGPQGATGPQGANGTGMLVGGAACMVGPNGPTGVIQMENNVPGYYVVICYTGP